MNTDTKCKIAGCLESRIQLIDSTGKQYFFCPFCKKHHKEIHTLDGFRNNTREQVEEYIK